MNDDDWELFVPREGETWPTGYEFKRWHDATWGRPEVVNDGTPIHEISEYTRCFTRFRKPKQKATAMTRTPQQAMQDAIDSGAVGAWIRGEDIESRAKGESKWVHFPSKTCAGPPFMTHAARWRPKPPEPTKIDWRPVVEGQEPEGAVLCGWKNKVLTCFYDNDIKKWRGSPSLLILKAPNGWAPLCNFPGGEID